MRPLAAIRVSAVALAMLIAARPELSAAAGAVAAANAPPSNILIGFVGGFVAHDDPHHGPVLFARRILPAVPKDTYVRIFENRRRRQAYAAIFHLLDLDHNGFLSPQEKSRARIVLFGHSWGASAAILLARDLRRAGVPVLLTVQVDSVAKAWQKDSIIPDNVAEAVNFYQPHGLIHGQRRITAADPAKTEILGNYRIDYKEHPVRCPEAPWLGRVLIPGHLQSECDSNVWSRIEKLVEQQFSAAETAAAVPAKP